MSTERDQLFLDIFTTALEGGIGYWSWCDEYHWSNEDGTDDVRGFFALIQESEEDGKSLRIDRSVIAKGYRLASVGEWRDRINWSSEKPPLVPDEDGWDCDAGDADCIVQLGLFGEVVYG